jgi:hypothetical protein
MNIEDIFTEWSKDSHIDRSELDSESLKTPNLQIKYLKWLAAERVRHESLKDEYKKLHLEKFTFYVDGPSKEQIKEGMELPPRGKILKNEADRYLDADTDLIKFKLKLAIQKEKVSLLEEIVKSLNNRGFQIRNAIEFMKFTNGNN